MSAPLPISQPVGYCRRPFETIGAAERRPSPLLICYPADRSLKNPQGTTSSYEARSVDPVPAEQYDNRPVKRLKIENEEPDSSDILFPSSPTCRLPLTPTHHLQSVPSSPSLTHNISQPPSPAANTAATSWQIIPDDASSASSQSSSEMDGFSLPAKEMISDSAPAVEVTERWDNHFCDPDAKIILRSNDGVKFRMSAWYLGRASEVFAAMFASSALSADKPVDIDACEPVVRALLDLASLSHLGRGTHFSYHKLGLALVFQLMDLADKYDFPRIRKEAADHIRWAATYHQLAPQCINLASGRGDLDLAIRAIPYLHLSDFQPKLSRDFEGMSDSWLSRLTYYFTMSKYHEPSWIGAEQKKEIARLFRKDMEALDGTAE